MPKSYVAPLGGKALSIPFICFMQTSKLLHVRAVCLLRKTTTSRVPVGGRAAGGLDPGQITVAVSTHSRVPFDLLSQKQDREDLNHLADEPPGVDKQRDVQAKQRPRRLSDPQKHKSLAAEPPDENFLPKDPTSNGDRPEGEAQSPSDVSEKSAPMSEVSTISQIRAARRPPFLSRFRSPVKIPTRMTRIKGDLLSNPGNAN
jgi:hypothetical protein